MTNNLRRQNVNQVVDYAKVSQATTQSTDGATVIGGAVGQIALGNAAFVPAPAQQGGAPPGAPPAGAPAAAPAAVPAAAPAAAPPAEAAPATPA